MFGTLDRRTRSSQPGRRRAEHVRRNPKDRRPKDPFAFGDTNNGQPRATAKPATDAEPAPAAADGRDSRGRFTQGNRGGPGNPFARKVAKLRSALLSAVSEDDVQAIGRRLARQAKKGDVAAAKVLLAYLIGKPAETTDPDRVDVDELQLYEEYPDGAAIGRALNGKIDAGDAAEFIRVALKIISPAVFGRTAKELRGKPA
jgi:hypothetical protein